MISEKLQEAINEQIKYELYSAYMYLAMSADCSDRNLTGFANWMRMQAQEEVEHAMRFYDFLIERGGRVELHQIDDGSPLIATSRHLAADLEWALGNRLGRPVRQQPLLRRPG